MTIQEILTNTPANAFQLQEKRPGTFQLIAPIFMMMAIWLAFILKKQVMMLSGYVIMA